MDEKRATNWQAAGIGILIAIVLFLVLCILSFLLGIIVDREGLFNTGAMIYLPLTLVAYCWPAIPFGMIGALIGKSLKNSRKAIWIGGIVGVVGGADFVLLACNTFRAEFVFEYEVKNSLLEEM